MITRRTLQLGLLFLGTGLAAQDSESWQHHNFAITLGGQSGYLDAEQTNSPFPGYTRTDRIDSDGGALFELRYGYQFHRNWEWTVGTSGYANKVRLEYRDNLSAGWIENTADDVTASAVLTGVKGHWYLKPRGVNFYGGAEIGYGVLDGVVYDTDGGVAWTAMIGAEFPIAEHFRLRVEGKHLGINVKERTLYFGYGYANSFVLEKPSYNSIGLSCVFGWGD